ncbi:MAG: hypothetical protein WCK34_07635 [Bacteroidota bacterium]
MGIDIKFPIGLMFTILGLLLSVFGFITNGDNVMYARSLGVNVNIWSGVGMLSFGLIMLFFAWRSKKPKTP